MSAHLTPELIALAVEVADATVRSDIELFALPQTIEGVVFYDLTRTIDARSQEAMGYIQRAVAYIQARGDVFAWRMLPHIDCSTLVLFVDKNPDSEQVIP